MTDDGAHPRTRRMMETAIRRLDALEYVILGVVMGLALLAGALSAWILEIVTGDPSRLVWAFSSLLFFVVPGWVVLRRERRAKEEAGAVTADEATADEATTAGSAPAEELGQEAE